MSSYHTSQVVSTVNYCSTAAAVSSASFNAYFAMNSSINGFEKLKAVSSESTIRFISVVASLDVSEEFSLSGVLVGSL